MTCDPDCSSCSRPQTGSAPVVEPGLQMEKMPDLLGCPIVVGCPKCGAREIIDVPIAVDALVEGLRKFEQEHLHP